MKKNLGRAGDGNKLMAIFRTHDHGVGWAGDADFSNRSMIMCVRQNLAACHTYSHNES